MMTPAMPSALFPELEAVCHQQGFPLSEEVLRQFEAFHGALYGHNAFKNLTRVPPEACEVRHFAESCLILEMIEGHEVLDIGTGPGFPAWPIAAARPELHVVALDSNGKMLDFLKTQPLENLSVELGRIEETGWSELADTVTGRALAPLPIQLEASAQVCKLGGVIIPFRTERDELEGEYLEVLGLKLERVERRTLSDGVVRVFPIYRKHEPTPDAYPRAWGMIKKKPLG